jgi:choline dehydrogenase
MCAFFFAPKQWNLATLKPFFRKFGTYAQGDNSREPQGPMHIKQVTERYDAN